MSLKNKNFIAYNLSTVNYTYSNCTIRSIFLYVYMFRTKLINEFSKVAGYKMNFPNYGKVPGSPVVKTPRFHCRGHGFDPWSEN